MTPLTSTLADLTAAELIAYYPVPAPGVTLVEPLTDPSVYVQDPSYIKSLNEQSYQKYAVDVPNQHEADQFAFLAKQWEANKSATSIPKPSFVVFDANAFNSWWTMLNATYTQGSSTYGQDAPPLFFVKPASLPPDPFILPAGTATAAAPPPVTDGPIGAAVPNNPGVFNSAGAADIYPDGYIYTGPTGIYQKHIYSNPFTAGQVLIVWVALQLTPAVPAAA